MQAIQKEEEVGIKEVAEVIKVSHNTASEHVKRLIEKKYVFKTRSSKDERKVILRLTDLGNEVLDRHTSLDEEKLHSLLFKYMNEQERKQILDAFTLMKERAFESFTR